MNEDSIKLKLLDFIFSIILEEKEIDFESILARYKNELSYYSIDSKYLEYLLTELIKDNKIYKSNDNLLKITPEAKNSSGYLIQDRIERKKESQKTFFDKLIKIVSVFLTIIFGVFASIMSYKNYVKNEIIDKQKITVDLLNIKIQKMKYDSERKIDSIKRENAILENYFNKIQNK